MATVTLALAAVRRRPPADMIHWQVRAEAMMIHDGQ
jgi:hypothetical protein